VFKIIQRAREKHLLDKFRSETKSISIELLEQVRSAWQTHVRVKVSKGLPENLRPAEGKEETIWPRLTELIRDNDWKRDCLRRDEKFDMYFSSAVRTWGLPDKLSV
jgi:cysteinyl-tRNA synthetase